MCYKLAYNLLWNIWWKNQFDLNFRKYTHCFVQDCLWKKTLFLTQLIRIVIYFLCKFYLLEKICEKYLKHFMFWHSFCSSQKNETRFFSPEVECRSCSIDFLTLKRLRRSIWPLLVLFRKMYLLYREWDPGFLWMLILS